MSSSANCTVCGSTKGSSLFYGGLVCCSCKVFFIRSVSNSSKYKCTGNGKCKIMSEGWVKCRWCRYQRCLKANMNPKAVGVIKERLASLQDELPSITPPYSSSSSSCSVTPPAGHVNTLWRETEEFEYKREKPVTYQQTSIDAWNKNTSYESDTILSNSQMNSRDRMGTQTMIYPYSYNAIDDVARRPQATNYPEKNRELLPVQLATVKEERDTPSSCSSSPCPSPSDIVAIPHRRATKRENAAVAYFRQGLSRTTEHLTTSYLIGLSFVDSLKQGGLCASALAQKLCTLESLCDVDDQTAHNFRIKCNLDTSLETTLRNPLEYCERSPMGWQDIRIVSATMEETFRGLYCRVTLHYLDWIHGLPELEMLASRDKITLISGQVCQMVLLTMMWNTYRSNSHGVLLSSGYRFLRSNEDDNEHVKEIDKFLTILYNYMHDEVITEFRRLRMREEEYVLLKAICFYNNMVQLSEEGVSIVRRSRQKYEQTLVEYIRETYPYLTRGEQSLRAYQIIALNKHAMTLAMADTAYLNRMFTLNIGNMQGRMIYDMHVKTYGSSG